MHTCDLCLPDTPTSIHIPQLFQGFFYVYLWTWTLMPHTSSCLLLQGHIRCHVFQAMFLSHDPGICSQWAKYQEVRTQKHVLRVFLTGRIQISMAPSHNFINSLTLNNVASEAKMYCI